MSKNIPSHAKKLKDEKKDLRKNLPDGVSKNWIPKTEEEPEKLLVSFKGPEGSLYQEEFFEVEFQFQDSYPEDPPKVRMLTKVFHPNIAGEVICINGLRQGYFPGIKITKIIKEIINALEKPNPDDFLDRNAADMYKNDPANFKSVVDNQILCNRKERNEI